jgi:transposase
MHQASILAESGHKQAAIAERLGVSPRMVRYYLADKGVVKDLQPRPSKLDPFKPFAESLLQEDPFYNLEVLFERLQKQGYGGRITILRDWAVAIRRGLILKAAIRFETEPGRQAQVDWKEAGVWNLGGVPTKVYAFVMLLGYSRRPFVWFTDSMKSPVLLACHVKAFEAFAGVPHEILYDNMKTAWLYDGENWVVNPKLLELAACVGFTPKRCQVRRPQTKGKVERFIQTLGTSFLPWAREEGLDSLDALNEKVNLWLTGLGGKTLRDFLETRDERFAAESAQLLPFRSETVPDLRELIVLTVNREGRVTFETNRYSVPARFLGLNLTLKLDRLTGGADLTDGGTVVRSFEIFPKGGRQIDDRLSDRSELISRWRTENLPKTPAAPPPVVVAVPIVEVRHPEYYDRLLEEQAAG